MTRLPILAACLAACTPLPGPNPPPQPPDATDAAQPVLDAGTTIAEAALPRPPQDDAGDKCERAYLLLVATRCEPIGGAHWIEVCRNDRKHGTFALDCIDKVKTFSDALSCGVGCMVP